MNVSFLWKTKSEYQKPKVCPSIRGNAWGVDLADMQLVSKFNKRFRFFLCVSDIYSEYAWVVSLKDANAFQKILNECNCKSKKYG